MNRLCAPHNAWRGTASTLRSARRQVAPEREGSQGDREGQCPRWAARVDESIDVTNRNRDPYRSRMPTLVGIREQQLYERAAMQEQQSAAQVTEQPARSDRHEQQGNRPDPCTPKGKAAGDPGRCHGRIASGGTRPIREKGDPFGDGREAGTRQRQGEPRSSLAFDATNEDRKPAPIHHDADAFIASALFNKNGGRPLEAGVSAPATRSAARRSVAGNQYTGGFACNSRLSSDDCAVRPLW
jgi:hypothetical protein